MIDADARPPQRAVFDERVGDRDGGRVAGGGGGRDDTIVVVTEGVGDRPAPTAELGLALLSRCAELVLEIIDDTTKTGGTCSASGSCSLTAALQTDNTVMRRSTCAAGPLVDSV